MFPPVYTSKDIAQMTGLTSREVIKIAKWLGLGRRIPSYFLTDKELEQLLPVIKKEL